MMGGASLHDREIEVEQSRAKLTQDLAVLCSVKTLSAFTDDLKKEAFDTRDALWEKIKARAASNPAAVIAIGTGLAWRIFQRPPISSALNAMSAAVCAAETDFIRSLLPKNIEFICETTSQTFMSRSSL